MKKEFEWTLITTDQQLVGSGTVTAENEDKAYGEVFRGLDFDVQDAILEGRLQIYIQKTRN